MRIIYSILLLTFISSHLFAQRSETMQTNDSTFNVIKQLKEVIITAEKRELSISEIPVSLSVISGKNLLNENTPDLRNLSGIVPNFYMQEGGLKLSTPLYMERYPELRPSVCTWMESRSLTKMPSYLICMTSSK